MLNRAATTAYSWWWASHIRTKQSKWLEQNLQDMEEKMKQMISIIDQEGDSFAKRAEMYYKKRPELINFVEESYKAYRALAERFDHISKDLQSANRTIATVFPEQVQLDLDSDDEDSLGGSTPDHSTKPPVSKNLPKAPKLPKPNPKGQAMIASKKEQLKRNVASGPVVMSSGLTKEEAMKEIDVLQKEILSLQTEKEFVKTAYENSLAKFLELENKVTDSQTKVSTLQDEFGIGTVIEDHDARTLMADSALKSCEESLTRLQKEHESSMESVKEEFQRLKEAQERLGALKKIHGEPQEEEVEQSSSFGEVEQEEPEKNHAAIRNRLNDELKLKPDAVFTEPEMAEKIDDLVEKIIRLETTICSLNALVKRLRLDIEMLLGHIKRLEEQNESAAGDPAIKERLRELELELIRVKELNQEVVAKKNDINAEITEAACNLEHLQENLPNIKPDEDAECLWLAKEMKAEQEAEAIMVDVENDGEKEKGKEKEKEKEKEEKDEEVKIETLRHIGSAHDTDVPGNEEERLNWRQLYFNNLEDREKILVEEYTIILRDYKNMKTKLTEMEKTHTDDNFELRALVEELKNTIIAKDEEIRMLRKMLSDLQNANSNANVDSIENANAKHDSGVEEPKHLREDEQNANNDIYQDAQSDDNGDKKDVLVSQTEKMKPLFQHLYDRDSINLDENDEDEKKSPVCKEIGPRRVKISLVTKTKPVSRTEGKLRAQLDNLLEANLDFWLRFSTSFHQIQKFQSSIKDLLSELNKLKESQKKSGEMDKSQQLSAKSDALPLYKHLREIETELTLWLEHSAVFQEELQSRFSSLNNIQDEINKVSSNKKAEDNELSDFQSAKFQGEILNMKQENSKVAEELQAGVQRIKALKVDVGKALTKLNKEYGILESKNRLNPMSKSSRIPLRSLLFGMRLKRSKQKPQLQSMIASGDLKNKISILEFPR